MQGQVTVTSLDRIYNWGRRNSIWPMMFGLACCAIEMICTAASRYDLARFGMEVMRPSPPAERSDDRLRHRDQENGPDHCASVQPNA